MFQQLVSVIFKIVALVVNPEEKNGAACVDLSFLFIASSSVVFQPPPPGLFTPIP